MLRCFLKTIIVIAALPGNAKSVEVYDSERPLNALKENLNDIYPLSTGFEEQKRPTPRAFHSMTATADGRYLLLFGGLQIDNGILLTENFLGDTHLFDTWTQGWTGELARPWCCTSGSVEDALDPSPQARERHRAAAIGHQTWVYGGRGPSVLEGNAVEYKRDLQYFDTELMTWSGEVQTTGPMPPARAGHGMAAIGSNLYVFGGRNEAGPLSDMWLFDTGLHEWSEIAQYGDIPSPRSEFGFSATEGKLYLVGGTESEETASRSDRHVFGDAYIFTLETKTWEKINCEVTSLREDFREPLQQKLLERYHHQILGIDDDHLIVWGGLWRDGSSILDEYNVLDIQSCKWYVNYDSLRSLPSNVNTRAPAHYGQAVSTFKGLIYEHGGMTKDKITNVGNTLYLHRLIIENSVLVFSLVYEL